MRIIETKVYKFDELTEQSKQKAIENLYDINVDHEWWDVVYEDAERIGLKITAFDLGRGSYVKGDFLFDAKAVAKEIIKEHGEHCETYKTAKNYQVEYARLVTEQCQEEADIICTPGELACSFDNFMVYDDIDDEEIEKEFLKSLCEDYRIMLQHEYEYLTSEEAIIETIQANEYEFTAEGKLI